MGYPVVGFQQGAVECFDCFRISEVERLAAKRMRHEEAFQLRAAPDQPRKIIRRPMLVARMELPFGVIYLFERRFQTVLSKR